MTDRTYTRTAALSPTRRGRVPASSQPEAPPTPHVRDPGPHGSAAALARLDLELSAQSLGPPAHARQPLSVARGRRVEADAVVRDFEREPRALDAEVNLDGGAARVAGRVVDRLLEDEQEVAAYVHAEPQPLLGVRRAEAQADVARREDLLGVLPHLAREV